MTSYVTIPNDIIKKLTADAIPNVLSQKKRDLQKDFDKDVDRYMGMRTRLFFGRKHTREEAEEYAEGNKNKFLVSRYNQVSRKFRWLMNAAETSNGDMILSIEDHAQLLDWQTKKENK